MIAAVIALWLGIMILYYTTIRRHALSLKQRFFLHFGIGVTWLGGGAMLTGDWNVFPTIFMWIVPGCAFVAGFGWLRERSMVKSIQWLYEQSQQALENGLVVDAQAFNEKAVSKLRRYSRVGKIKELEDIASELRKNL